MDCIIIDDEATARIVTEHLCSQIPDLSIKQEFSNGIEAIKYLNQHSVDLIFLDIHMPGFTGFDFIETIKDPPAIILTTSDSNMAINAFEYDCIIDYLVKPIELSRLEKAIKKVENFKITEQNSEFRNVDLENHLYINIDRRLIKIDIPSIYLVEAKGDYINLKTENKDYRVHSSLKKIEDKLPESLFLKVHRSYIINLEKIIDIEDNSVLIKKDVIPVSRSNRPELMKRLNFL